MGATLAILFFAALALALAPATSSTTRDASESDANPTPDGAHGVVRGTVHNPVLRTVVASALLVLRGPDGLKRRTFTSADGRYAFVDLPEGEYDLVARDGSITAARSFRLARDEEYEADFSMDPDRSGTVLRRVETPTDSKAESRAARRERRRSARSHRAWMRVSRQKARQDARAERRRA